MARSVHLADEPKRSVRLTDPGKPRMSPSIDLGEMLGAVQVVPAPPGGGSPAAWHAIREETVRRLKSTGGRPSIPGTEAKKVTVSNEDWAFIRSLAEAMAGQGSKPSLGQVAGVILHRALEQLRGAMGEE